MNIDLTRKHALVCGSTQGIGKAAAVVIASLGAAVTLVARNEKKLKELANSLNQTNGQRHGYLVHDFTTYDGLQEKIRGLIAERGDIHILVNNTGGPAAGAITDAKPEEFLQTFTSHLICNHVLVCAVIDGMKKHGYGRIINIISTSVRQPIPGLGVSNTIRGAVAAWAKTLAGELGQYGITVNNVLPGATNTERLRSLYEKKATASGKTVEQIYSEQAAIIPLRRIAEPEEIANLIAFLASPAASYISGVSIPVDGGRLECI